MTRNKKRSWPSDIYGSTCLERQSETSVLRFTRERSLALEVSLDKENLVSRTALWDFVLREEQSFYTESRSTWTIRRPPWQLAWHSCRKTGVASVSSWKSLWTGISRSLRCKCRTSFSGRSWADSSNGEMTGPSGRSPGNISRLWRSSARELNSLLKNSLVAINKKSVLPRLLL